MFVFFSRRKLGVSLSVLMIVLGLTSIAQAATLLAVETVVSGLIRPVYACAPPGDYDRLFVVEQRGSAGTATRADIRILDLRTRTVESKSFLSISPVATGNEEGLLGLAFHPDYATNGFFFTYHTNSSGNNIVTRWQVSTANPDSADPASGTVILTINHPVNSNHNGGWIDFGADGYLYIATGDGGGGGDTPNNAQNLNTILGKMLRLDVDHGSPYTIPASNPFFGGSERQEIFHYGLRNPWRNSFDRLTGELYVGDVGQGAWEEIDWRPANDTGGINFGWRLLEGTHCYNPSTNCDPAGVTTLPIYEYDHGSGCAVTGGYVYRGCMIPDLNGTYFCGDYCSGTIWSFRFNGIDTADFRNRSTELGLNDFGLSAFAQDNFGEVYLLYQSGVIMRLIPQNPFVDCNGNHMPDSCDIALGIALDGNGNGIPDGCENLCGDAEQGGGVDISDAVFLISYIFSGGSAPSPLSQGDANCDSAVDISDAVYLITYIFAGGLPPCANCP